MKDALFNALPIVVPLIVLLMYLGYILRTKGKDAALSELRELAYALMVKAQKQFGDGHGSIKMDWVVEKIKPLLPRYTWVFMDEEDLRRWLQALYEKTLDLLDDGKINGSQN